MSEKAPVFQIGDSFVDPNGNAVKADGTPLHADTATDSTDALRSELAQATKERDDALKGALPADARERLIAVKGIGDALADDILKALKG